MDFISYYGHVFQPPPLLNTNMKYWTVDPNNNLTTPYLWTIDIIKGPTDNASVFKAVVGDRGALGLRVIRTNSSNAQIWTTVHVRQDVRGQGLGEIFRSNITVDVFPTFQYLYDPHTKNPENAFGVEINDGTNLIWYIFADEPSQIFQLPHNRIILTRTPLNVWSTRSMNISSEYAAEGWVMPTSISFTFITGTTWLHLGNWVGYFSNLSVSIPTLQTQQLTPAQTAMVVGFDALAIICLGLLVAWRWKRAMPRTRRARN